MELIQKIHVTADPALEKSGGASNSPVDMKVLTSDGNVYVKRTDITPGSSANPLTQQEQEEHFWDCIDFAKKPLQREKAEKIISLILHLEELEDVRILIPLLLV
jgi:2-methylcitrate dehydratase PrpD